MKLYFELLKHPVFTMENVKQYYNNIESAHSAVKRLIKSGYLQILCFGILNLMDTHFARYILNVMKELKQ